MLGQKSITNARPHLWILSISTLCRFWNWGLSPSHQEFLWTLSWAGRATSFHLQWFSSDLLLHAFTSNVTLSFNFYSMLSLLAAVALSKWKMKKKNKGSRRCFKRSVPKSAPQVNSAKVNLHGCCKCSCCHRSLERPALWPILNTQSLIHDRNLIKGIHFF